LRTAKKFSTTSKTSRRSVSRPSEAWLGHTAAADTLPFVVLIMAIMAIMGVIKTRIDPTTVEMEITIIMRMPPLSPLKR
jgi:hypothetical protein